MSLRLEPIGEIPGETVRVARAAFPNTTVEFKRIRTILLGSVMDCSERVSERSEYF
jgi:hypothetical protein